MASGNLPAQTPAVPQEMYNAINDIYIYLKSTQPYMKLMDTGFTGTVTVVTTTFTVKNGIIVSIV